jgi:hypothetical protein
MFEKHCCVLGGAAVRFAGSAHTGKTGRNGMIADHKSFAGVVVY